MRLFPEWIFLSEDSLPDSLINGRFFNYLKRISERYEELKRA